MAVTQVRAALILARFGSQRDTASGERSAPATGSGAGIIGSFRVTGSIGTVFATIVVLISSAIVAYCKEAATETIRASVGTASFPSSGTAKQSIEQNRDGCQAWPMTLPHAALPKIPQSAPRWRVGLVYVESPIH